MLIKKRNDIAYSFPSRIGKNRKLSQRIILGSSSKDLPSIYLRFTFNLPSIYLEFTFKSIIFGLLLNKIYLHFTFNLPSIYIQFTFILPSLTFSLPSTLPSTYLQFTFNLPSNFGWNIFAWNPKYFCVVKISKAKKANVNKR